MGAVDLAIVIGYLVAVVAVGAFFSRRQRTTRHYFTGGGAVPWWAVAASIVATETSTVTFLSVPGWAYARGGNLTFLQLALGYVVGRAAIALIFIPKYFKRELLTVYELLEERFGAGVKGALAALFVGMRTVGDGIRLLLTAGVLTAVWRAFDPAADGDAVLAGACLSLGLVMVLFTLWGGMEAVIWIEVGQLCVYLLGALCAAAVLLGTIPGGAESAGQLAERFGKTRVLDFSFALGREAGMTFWAGVVGGCFLNMSTHGTDQYLVQRYLCVGRARPAALALLVSGGVVLLQFALFLGIGLLLFAHYAPYELPNYAELPAAAPFAKGDAVFTDFITRGLPRGLGGFVVAAILAAALSSSLNSIAAAAVNDLIGPLRRSASDADRLRLAKRLTVAAGAAQVGVALLARHSQESALEGVLSVAGLANGPVLGIFLLGTFVPRAGRAAGIVGLLAGTALALFVWRTPLHWAWYTAAGALATVGAGAATSLAAPRRETAP